MRISFSWTNTVPKGTLGARPFLITGEPTWEFANKGCHFSTRSRKGPKCSLDAGEHLSIRYLSTLLLSVNKYTSTGGTRFLKIRPWAWPEHGSRLVQRLSQAQSKLLVFGKTQKFILNLGSFLSFIEAIHRFCWKSKVHSGLHSCPLWGDPHGLSSESLWTQLEHCFNCL